MKVSVKGTTIIVPKPENDILPVSQHYSHNLTLKIVSFLCLMETISFLFVHLD